MWFTQQPPLQIANATGLTLGLYKFVLTVTDENNNTASAPVWIKVVQEKNLAPTANAGGDQILTLPLTAIYLNGSASSDDLGIVAYRWTREDDSLAAGQVVDTTDTAPVMIVRYFRAFPAIHPYLIYLAVFLLL